MPRSQADNDVVGLKYPILVNWKCQKERTHSQQVGDNGYSEIFPTQPLLNIPMNNVIASFKLICSST